MNLPGRTIAACLVLLLTTAVRPALGAEPLLYGISAHPNGSITKYRSDTGAQAGQYQSTYTVGATTHLPRLVTPREDRLYLAYGNRYLARLRASDGQRDWLVDGGITAGATTYLVGEIAYAGDVFYTVNSDPTASITKYRASDGAQLARYASSYQAGATTHLPRLLVPVGDRIYLAYGNRYLARIRASDGQRDWLVDAGITQGATTYNAVKVAWAGGQLYVANSLGYLSQYNPANGQRNWQADARVTSGGTTYLILEMAVAAGILYPIHSDPTGYITRFRASDGAELGQYGSTYQVGATTNLPRLASANGAWLHMAYGNRYVSRLRASDGQRQWLVDAGIQQGATTWSLAELAPELVPPTIAATPAPPLGTQNIAYQHALVATGDYSPFTWSLTGGSLPTGLSLGSDGILSGTPSTAGTFNFTAKATDALFATATASFTVVIQTPFAAWQTARFGANAGNPAIAGDLADPEGDGLANLIEYPTGTDPGAASSAPSGSLVGNALTLTFSRSVSATDVTLIVQGSDNLIGWDDLARSLGGAAMSALLGGVSVTESGSGATRMVAVRDLYQTTDPGHPRRALRLKVTRP